MSSNAVSIYRDESRQLGRADLLPVRDDDIRVPRLGHVGPQPIRGDVPGDDDPHPG